MARALIVGCGCRGRSLGARLLEAGWQVRGTTRDPETVTSIEEAGLEAVLADPDRPGTIVDAIDGVTVVAWLMGTASGEPGMLAAIHGPRLEAVLEELSDSPVRGFLYEAAGTVEEKQLAGGAAIAAAAAERWRIPVSIHRHDPLDREGWTDSTAAAIQGMLSR